MCASSINNTNDRNHPGSRLVGCSNTRKRESKRRIWASRSCIAHRLSFSRTRHGIVVHMRNLLKRLLIATRWWQFRCLNSFLISLKMQLVIWSELRSFLKGCTRCGWYRVSTNSSFGMILRVTFKLLTLLCHFVRPSCSYDSAPP